MTTLYTASWRAWTPRLGQPVAVSLTRPKGAEGWPALWAATPRWAYFRADPEEFTRAYLAQLARYGSRAIAERLAEITRETGAERLVLLCWEADPARCHRSTFARYWLEATGEVVNELEGTSLP